MEFTWPELPDSTVPFLEEYGSNWATFTMHFRQAILATCQWYYCDGTNTCPVLKDAAHPTNAEHEAMKEWEHEGAVAQYLLFARLPDWLALGLDDDPLAQQERKWDWLIRTFGQPGQEDSRKEKELTGEPPAATGRGSGQKRRCRGKHLGCREEGHRARDCRTPKEELATALIAQEPLGAAEWPENSPRTAHARHACRRS